MTYTAVLTQKGQVTVPLEIRKFLGLAPYKPVAFVRKNDEVLVKPAKNFLSLKGSLRTPKRFNDRKADKKMGEFIASEYAKKTFPS